MTGTQRFGSAAALAAAFFLLSTAVVPDASAYISGDGKGKPETDCFIGLEGYSPSDMTPFGKKGKPAIQCTDGDPACDFDGDTTPNGSCTFRIAARVNDPNVPGCTPVPLKKVKAKAKAKKMKVDLVADIPPDVLTEGRSWTGSLLPFTVSVKKFGKPKVKAGKGKVALLAKKPKDKDKFLFACNPGSATTTTTTMATTTTSIETTTTVITSTSTTTSTTCPPPSGPSDPVQVLFTNSLGTDDCGGATRVGEEGVWRDGNPPFSGQLLDENDTVLGNLGLSCLYLGGGAAFNVPPGGNPDNATNTFTVAGVCADGTLQLAPDAGTSDRDCTLGPLSTSSCIHILPATTPCTQDADCAGGGTGACAQDAACFFGTPLPIANAGLSTCVINAILDGVGGTVDPTTGEADIVMPLQSRVYLTGNGAQPCPTCVDNVCDPNWVTASPPTQSPNAGEACVSTAAAGVTHDCLPAGFFVGRIPVNLTPLTTGSTMLDSVAVCAKTSPETQCETASDCATVCSGVPAQVCTTSDDCPTGQTCGDDTCVPGKFCPGQVPTIGPGLNGAFGLLAARTIVETGAPAGDITGGPGNAILASTFCVPATGNGLIDGSADLPGPGATSLPGAMEIVYPAP
jgi:hypothetical protein